MRLVNPWFMAVLAIAAWLAVAVWVPLYLVVPASTLSVRLEEIAVVWSVAGLAFGWAWFLRRRERPFGYLFCAVPLAIDVVAAATVTADRWPMIWRHRVEMLAIVLLLARGVVLSGLLVLHVRWWQRGGQKSAFVCPRCAYNLTGNISGVCPECGLQVSMNGGIDKEYTSV
jgi:peptidoglycan/LPS O-acetylase OafA/YrhL